MSTTRTHSTLDLGRFRYSCPNWWTGFQNGMAGGRYLAAKEERDAGHQSEADRQENKAKEYIL